MSWIGGARGKRYGIGLGNLIKGATLRPLLRSGLIAKSALILAGAGLAIAGVFAIYYGEGPGLLISPWWGSGVDMYQSGSQISPERLDVATAPVKESALPGNEDIVVEDSVAKRETMVEILENAGVSREEAIEAIKTAKSSYNLAKLKVGKPYRIEASQSGSLQKLQYEIDDARTLLLEKSGDGFKATIKKELFDTSFETVSGSINSSLFNAIVDAGEEPNLALELAKIFAWDIDFSTDLQPGDSFRFVVEKSYKKGRFVKYGTITIAELKNSGQLHRAVLFDDGKGRAGYYKPDGMAMKKQFLKSPIKYSRISSGYTSKRFHPILRKFMPHFGIDYAAPKGTPVVAVADGEISWAGRKGWNGNFVQIKHSGGYSSSYGHLSGYAASSKSKARIKQGQVVGYVGSTGLATGPHLDFRMTKNGKYLNPLGLKSIQADPLTPGQLALFKKVLKERMAMLEGTKMKVASRVEQIPWAKVD